jgi:hypothetical protein
VSQRVRKHEETPISRIARSDSSEPTDGRNALVLDVLEQRTSLLEAARKHGLAPVELAERCQHFLDDAGDALRTQQKSDAGPRPGSHQAQFLDSILAALQSECMRFFSWLISELDRREEALIRK